MQNILLKAVFIVLFSAALAVATNAMRPSGIPLTTDVPYEIFAPCKDSEAIAEGLSQEDFVEEKNGNVLYVDARPKEDFDAGHATGAMNVPYSALFGAKEQDITQLRKKIKENRIQEVVVYGVVEDPTLPGKTIELSKPLADQLIEAGIKGVKYVEGGLATLNKAGVISVTKGGE